MDDLIKEASLEAFLFHSNGTKAIDPSSQDQANDSERSRVQICFYPSNFICCAADWKDKEVNFYTDDKGVDSKDLTLDLWKDSSETVLINKDSQQSQHARHLLNKGQTTELNISEYEEQLRKRHKELHQNTGWAKLPTHKEKKEKMEKMEKMDLLCSTESLLSVARPLRKGRIDTTPAMDANSSDQHRSMLSSIDYSPNGGELFLSASKTGRLCFFHIDGIKNPLLDCMTIQNFKLIKAGFLSDKMQVVVIGTPQFQSIHLLDLETKTTERIFAENPKELYEHFDCGNEASSELVAFVSNGGTVPLYSLKSRQWITKLQSNRKIESAVFSKNGHELFTCGTGGKLNIWDLRTFKCVNELIDQGTLHCTAMMVCPNNKYLATGSDAGVVNIYKMEDLQITSNASQQLMPMKTIFNLQTEINTLAFHPSSQILAMASMHASSAVKLVHLPSCTVFSNWPDRKLSTSRIKCIVFSPNKDLINLGSLSGRISTFRLLHYANKHSIL